MPDPTPERAADPTCTCADWSGALVLNPQCRVHFVHTNAADPTPEALEAAEYWLGTPPEGTVRSYGEARAAERASLARALDSFAQARAEAAVEKEREECCQIALAYRDEAEAGIHPDIGDPHHSLGQGFAANCIARRIRYRGRP